MNSIAEKLGYVEGLKKTTLAEQMKNKRILELSASRDHIINILGEGDDDKKKAVATAIDKMLVKYKDKFENGEYHLLTENELIHVSKGVIVEEDEGVIIWSKRTFLDWDDMDEIE